MKKIVFIVVMAVTTIVTVQAQEKSGFRMEKRMRPMNLQKLNLSDDQKVKFKSTNEEFRKQMQELKKQDDITVKEWKNRMKSLRKSHKEKIQGLLTNDQKAQLKKLKEARRGKFKAGSEKRMEKMKKRLALTDEQSSKIKGWHAEMSEKLKTLKENNSLGREEKKEQAKDLVKQNKEKMRSILTKEQLKQLKEGRHKRHRKKQRV